MIYELSKSKENLTAEQEQLKTQFNNLTGEMEALQKQYDSVVASRDGLQEEFDRLNPTSNMTGRKFETPERLFFSVLLVQLLPVDMTKTQSEDRVFVVYLNYFVPFFIFYWIVGLLKPTAKAKL